ncbi:NBS-containing resistance-like protein [Trifolium pratense]|uniref:NBS-containing resistance-like protein n=1 Tax=Trifolium pratense TaxID=57577 RepID=A0A2K3JWY7_TRIPR|nr:NBS-containing resistance-like protein [Trifolium pratense]
MECIDSSHIRSLLFFTNSDSLVYFANRIPTKYRLLKVLDHESVQLLKVPKKLENLDHLKYLSFWQADVEELLKSIGMLQNLETLDVIRNTYISELPKDISKLRKLRHLLSDELSLIQLKDGIGEMTSLQTLQTVDINGAVEVLGFNFKCSGNSDST